MALANILFKVDLHHYFNSRDLIGVFTNKNELVKVLRRIIKEELEEKYEGDELKKQMNWMLGFCLEKKQTQGLPNFELVFEELPINRIF